MMADAEAEICKIRQRYFEGHRSPIFHAIDADQPVAVDAYFLENDIDQTNGSGFTPLLTAALFCESLNILRIILDNRASVAAKCDGGLTALHIAALRGKTDYIDMLARNKAPLEIEDGEGRTPILLATSYGVTDAVEALTRHGCDVNHPYLNGSSAMHEAVRQKRLDMVTILLRALPDLKSQFDGKTPVELASSLGYVDIYDHLMRFRVEKALQTAVLNDVTDSIPWIFSVEPRVEDATGVALCMAILKRSETWVKALLNHSSDARSYVDNAHIGRVSWLTYALGGSTPPSARVVRLLMEAGASTDSPILCHLGVSSTVESKSPVQCVRTSIAINSGKSEEHLFQLKRILRLFEQASAVHATSWVWPKTITAPAHATDGKGRGRSSAIVHMLPLLCKKRLVLSQIWR